MMAYSFFTPGCADGRIHTMKCCCCFRPCVLVLPPTWWPTLDALFQLWGTSSL